MDDEDQDAATVKEERRREALVAFLWAGMTGTPDKAVIVMRLADARRAVAMHQERGWPPDSWLADEVRLRGIRENAAVLAALEVPAWRAASTSFGPVRPAAVRVEWQLYELDTCELLRCPPKDESRCTVDVPEWLAELLSDQVVRVQPKPCACHGQPYVFRSHGSANGAAGRTGPKLVDVARHAGVSSGTVSAVFNRPAAVPEATRVQVDLAATELGYVPGGGSGELAAHWRRNGFATWLFQPAATGR